MRILKEKCIQALQLDDCIITICREMTVAPMNYAARSLRLRIPRICVAITGTEASDLLEKAEAVLRENTLIELRLDYLKAPLAALPRLRRMLELRPGATIIATANPGCMLQLRAGVARHGHGQRVLHVIELLDEAYGHTPGEPA